MKPLMKYNLKTWKDRMCAGTQIMLTDDIRSRPILIPIENEDWDYKAEPPIPKVDYIEDTVWESQTMNEPNGNRLIGKIRTITEVKSNHVLIDGSRLDFPKASELDFWGTGFRILNEWEDGGTLELTYEFIE
tara:strand:- start:342 stop:737 length:396 start_codon:yes stop_codon:yes gene_type:complete